MCKHFKTEQGESAHDECHTGDVPDGIGDVQFPSKVLTIGLVSFSLFENELLVETYIPMGMVKANSMQNSWLTREANA